MSNINLTNDVLNGNNPGTHTVCVRNCHNLEIALVAEKKSCETEKYFSVSYMFFQFTSCLFQFKPIMFYKSHSTYGIYTKKKYIRL